MSNEKRARQRANREQRRAEQAAAARKAARAKTIRNGVVVGGVAIAAGLLFFFLTDSGDDTSAVVTTTSTAPTTVATPATTTTAPPDDAEPATPVAGEIETDEYLAFRGQPTACGGDVPPPAQSMSFSAPDDVGIEPASTPVAVLRTSCGDVTIELDPAAAPETVNSFVFLAEQGYFDGTASHRILPGFVVQAGDPTATGRGGPGYTVPDELPEAGFSYERGVVAMANAGPNTTGSQFFLVLGDTTLGPDFSVFGTVVDGFEALDAMAAVPLAARGTEVSLPTETVYIESVDVTF